MIQIKSWGSDKPIRSNGEGKPIVALDIDGTLGDYHGNFLDFARRYFDSARYPIDLWTTDRTNPGRPLWEWMGIQLAEYREAKLAYRQGGWKRWMPAYEGAAELTAEIRSAGAEVWICTTRPYLRLDNVDPDTREWLRRRRIQYDAVLFDPANPDQGTKYTELFRQAGSRVASIVDDLPDMIDSAIEAAPVGSPVWPTIRDQPYNRWYDWSRRCGDMDSLGSMVHEDLSAWKEDNA